MSATCYYCGWWTDINGVCVCGYSGKPTTRSDSCVAWKPQTEIVTNADRIRAMTDEELAQFLYEYGGSSPNCDRLNLERDYKSCKDCWLDWLKQEAKD